jgi:WD40 repeat protein
VDGTGLRRLHPERPDLRDECCGAWTADGKYFLFWSNSQVWGLARKSRFLGPEPKPIQLTSSLMPLQRPFPSTDGKKVFVVGQTNRGELVRYNPQSGRFEPFLGGISAEYVDFSPDGQWMAYVTFPDQVLWRSKVDGSERLQLTYAPAQPFIPRWSPDGKTIAFFDARHGKDPKIHTVSPEGGNPRPLLPDDPGPQADPNWSPDGSKIVFGAGPVGPKTLIRILDLATHQVTTLPGSQGLFGPRWSPDGRYIAALNADLTKLLIFDFQTQKWTEVAKGSPGWPGFTKDGKYLYFQDISGTGLVMRFCPRDLRVERVADLKNVVMVGQYGTWFAPTPDGSFMLLCDAGTTDVYSLDWQEP